MQRHASMDGLNKEKNSDDGLLTNPELVTQKNCKSIV